MPQVDLSNLQGVFPNAKLPEGPVEVTAKSVFDEASNTAVAKASRAYAPNPTFANVVGSFALYTFSIISAGLLPAAIFAIAAIIDAASGSTVDEKVRDLAEKTNALAQAKLNYDGDISNAFVDAQEGIQKAKDYQEAFMAATKFLGKALDGKDMRTQVLGTYWFISRLGEVEALQDNPDELTNLQSDLAALFASGILSQQNPEYSVEDFDALANTLGYNEDWAGETASEYVARIISLESHTEEPTDPQGDVPPPAAPPTGGQDTPTAPPAPKRQPRPFPQPRTPQDDPRIPGYKPGEMLQPIIAPSAYDQVSGQGTTTPDADGTNLSYEEQHWHDVQQGQGQQRTRQAGVFTDWTEEEVAAFTDKREESKPSQLRPSAAIQNQGQLPKAALAAILQNETARMAKATMSSVLEELAEAVPVRNHRKAMSETLKQIASGEAEAEFGRNVFANSQKRIDPAIRESLATLKSAEAVDTAMTDSYNAVLNIYNEWLEADVDAKLELAEHMGQEFAKFQMTWEKSELVRQPVWLQTKTSGYYREVISFYKAVVPFENQELNMKLQYLLHLLEENTAESDAELAEKLMQTLLTLDTDAFTKVTNQHVVEDTTTNRARKGLNSLLNFVGSPKKLNLARTAPKSVNIADMLTNNRNEVPAIIQRFFKEVTGRTNRRITTKGYIPARNTDTVVLRALRVRDATLTFEKPPRYDFKRPSVFLDGVEALPLNGGQRTSKKSEKSDYRELATSIDEYTAPTVYLDGVEALELSRATGEELRGYEYFGEEDASISEAGEDNWTKGIVWPDISDAVPIGDESSSSEEKTDAIPIGEDSSSDD